MPSCGNSSNILSTNNNITITASGAGSRLLCNLTSGSYDPGITGGDAIYYNVAGASYFKSRADDQVTAEVFGVVESYNQDGSLSVVIAGSINLDNSVLADSGLNGLSGGKDIYFLSGLTAGKLVDVAPTEVGHIVKPVYQKSPHGAYTGIIQNYIGYVIGSDTVATVADNLTGNIGTLILVPNGYDAPEHYAKCDGETIVTVTDNQDFLNKFDLTLPYIMKVIPYSASGSTKTPDRKWIGSKIAADSRAFAATPDRAQYKYPEVTLFDADSTYYYFKVTPPTYSYNGSKPSSKINTSSHIFSSGSSKPAIGFSHNWFFFDGLDETERYGGYFYVNGNFTLHGLITPKISFTNNVFSYGTTKAQSFSDSSQEASPIQVYMKIKGESSTSIYVPDELSVDRINADTLYLSDQSINTWKTSVDADIAAIKAILRLS